MANANSNPNPFTSKHESLGFLVQSQSTGKFMVLRHSDDTGYVRLAVNINTYGAACEIADRMADAIR